MQRYKVSALVGEGSFGHVYKALRKEDNQVVAIKVISKRCRTSRDLKILRRECEIQAHLKHPNVIEMLESFETKHDLVVVTEFASIDLARYIEKHGYLPEDKGQKLICDLISALYYLHSNRILHRDLKPQNVLLDEELRGKLCDFGLARNMTMSTHMLTSIKGTPLYMAPELLEEKPYDHLADIWSLGCIAYECLIGCPPFTTTSIFHLIKIIKKDEITYPGYLSKPCRSFLQSLLEKEATMRASWAQILCHPFVEGRIYINAGVKSENSPFINPNMAKSKSKPKTPSAEENSLNLSKISEKLLAIKLDEPAEELNSSQDSIIPIPPSDMEQLETDIEDNINQGVVMPFANESFSAELRLKRQPHPIVPMAMIDITHVPGVNAPVINSQTCFVNGNPNMILNNFNDNFIVAGGKENIQCQQKTSDCGNNNSVINNDNSALQDKTNVMEQKTLRKASDTQNSEGKENANEICLKGKARQEQSKMTGSESIKEKSPIKHNNGNEPKDTSVEKHGQAVDRKNLKLSPKDKQNLEKDLKCNSKSTENSEEERHATASGSVPLWDSCDDSSSPPMESDEWLDFLNRTMQEVLDGELDTLKQKNLVSFIITALRNAKAVAKVLEGVAQLFSLPFVMNEPLSVMEVINQVYVDCKLVPNLMYASKLLIYERLMTDSNVSLSRNARSIGQLAGDEVKCIARLFELICHLVHLNQQFLNQFCDAVTILSAKDFLIDFLNGDFKNPYILRTGNCVLALLGCVLRELPENAELVEKIIFSKKIDMNTLLRNDSALMRLRMCMLIRLLGRFSLRGLQTAWSREMREALEALGRDADEEVKEEANHTLDELKRFSFYS